MDGHFVSGAYFTSNTKSASAMRYSGVRQRIFDTCPKELYAVHIDFNINASESTEVWIIKECILYSGLYNIIHAIKST